MLRSLFTKSKQKILGLLFLNPDKQFYLREIMRMTGISLGTIHRELKPLIRDGILISESRGQQAFYSVNRESPIFAELRGLIYKSFGVADTLQSVLKPFRKQIIYAGVYGSIARGEDNSRSDIDLLLVGSVQLLDLAEALEKAEKALGRPINPTVFPVQEFQQKSQSRNHFIGTILNSPIISLQGSEDELRKLAGKQVA